MRLIDADRLIKGFKDHEFIDTHIIWNAPTVDVEPVRHGKWIRDEFGTMCCACGLYAYRDKFGKPWESPYCPNCGAKMDAEREEQ